MPSTDTVHRELCHALFDALEHGDVAGVERCYAPDMTMWFTSPAPTSPGIEGGFVQQHTIEVTWQNGFEGRMDVCLVGYTRDGRISRAYEYFDTGQIEGFLGPRERDREREREPERTSGPPEA